jgi:hypothetical protein
MRKNPNFSLPLASSFEIDNELQTNASFCERKVEELQALKSKYGFLKNSYVFFAIFLLLTKANCRENH